MNEQSVEKKTQTMRYNEAELGLIKNNFEDNDILIKAIRKHFLQMPLMDVDETWINSVKKNKDLLAVLKKSLLPTLDPEAPSTQLLDLWLTVQIAEKTPQEAIAYLEARYTLIKYLEQRFDSLEGKETEKAIKFDDLVYNPAKTDDKAYSDLVARNTLITHVDRELYVLKVLAKQTEDTPEQALQKMKKNSNK